MKNNRADLFIRFVEEKRGARGDVARSRTARLNPQFLGVAKPRSTRSSVGRGFVVLVIMDF